MSMGSVTDIYDTDAVPLEFTEREGYPLVKREWAKPVPVVEASVSRPRPSCLLTAMLARMERRPPPFDCGVADGAVRGRP